jgi:hypothetical protein
MLEMMQSGSQNMSYKQWNMSKATAFEHEPEEIKQRIIQEGVASDQCMMNEKKRHLTLDINVSSLVHNARWHCSSVGKSFYTCGHSPAGIRKGQLNFPAIHHSAGSSSSALSTQPVAGPSSLPLVATS